MTATLPLFPLNSVLYPGAPIALHIFEERYRTMIGRCLEQSSPFGVVLIRSGSEVDPNDPFVRRQRALTDGDSPEESYSADTVPHSVGATARITESHRFDDGRYYLTAVGVRRFRVQYIAQRHPYLVASVSVLPDQTTPELPGLASALRELYARYWKMLAAATGTQYEPEALPEDPVELSYAMAHRLKVELPRKQRWLEAEADLRLRELLAALQGELALMPGSGRWPLN